MTFYTYIHIRKDNGKVFYVGKGRKRRPNAASSRSEFWRNIVAKAGGRTVVICARWPTEEEAFRHEVFLIDTFRKMGCELCNLTDGGDGVSGYIPTPEVTARRAESLRRTLAHPKAKAQRSEAMRQLWREKRDVVTAALAAPEVKAKRIAAMMASVSTDEFRRKKSEQAQAQWRDPELRRRMVAIAQRKSADQDYRSKMRLTMSQKWAEPEYREMMSTSRRAVWDNPDRRLAQSARMMELHAPKRKAVHCVTTGQKFQSVNAAAKALGLNSGNISRVCNGTAPSTGGLVFHFITPSTEPPSPKP